MKLLILILLILPLSGSAQALHSASGTSFSIIDNEVVYSKVYESDLHQDDLVKELESSLNNLGGFEIKRKGVLSDQINGTLKESTVNYRRYGGTLMGTNIVMNSPFDANVVIQLKDNRYRVLVTNIIFKKVPNAFNGNLLDFTFEDLVTRRKRSEFRAMKDVDNILKYTDQHLAELFDIANAKQVIADDW